MEIEEYREIMFELYKFLRDKISLSLNDYLSDSQKEKLFSLDLENIVVDSKCEKFITYSPLDNKIYISDGLLTPEYVDKIKSKNTSFDLEDLKSRITEENPKILLEELIAFSKELKIQEKDIVKSLYIQEILKMTLKKDNMDPKEEVVINGVIELLAHTLGNQNGFLVSTPKKLLNELKVAISLKDELEDNFESIVLSDKLLNSLSNIKNTRLINKIDDLAEEIKIIESTQNLEDVVASIKKQKEKEIEEILDIDEPIEKEEKIEEVKPEKEETKEVKKDEFVTIEKDLTKKDPKVAFKKIVLCVGVILLVAALGILVGWILFKLK